VPIQPSQPCMYRPFHHLEQYTGFVLDGFGSVPTQEAVIGKFRRIHSSLGKLHRISPSHSTNSIPSLTQMMFYTCPRRMAPLPLLTDFRRLALLDMYMGRKYVVAFHSYVHPIQRLPITGTLRVPLNKIRSL